MNSFQAADAVDLLNSLSVFKNGTVIELPLKQFETLSRNKPDLISLLKDNGIIQLEPYEKIVRREVPPPFMFVTDREEWVRLSLDEILWSEFQKQHATYIITSTYDFATQLLTLRTGQTVIGKIKFNNSGVWFKAVESMGEKVSTGARSKTKTPRAQLSNHPKFAILKYITRFDNTRGTVMIQPRSIVTKKAYDEIKKAFTG